jgi:hypothetical protein
VSLQPVSRHFTLGVFHVLIASLADSRLVNMTMARPYRAEPMRYMRWKLQNVRDTHLSFVPFSNNEGCFSNKVANEMNSTFECLNIFYKYFSSFVNNSFALQIQGSVKHVTRPDPHVYACLGLLVSPLSKSRGGLIFL